MSFTMYSPTRILFGAGMLDALKEQNMPGKKALIVVSNGKSTKANGYLKRVEDILDSMDIEHVLFDEIEANPVDETIMRGSEKGRENECDFVVALGGGSVLDASKAIASMITNEGTIMDYIFGGSGGCKIRKEKALPVVAITTTAGTGSEVDTTSVISNLKTKEKLAYGASDDLFPVIAVVDPELMTTVPPKFTAYQGFDALFHSTEGYISNFSNHMSDMYSLTAVKYIGKYLARAVKDGTDIEAREGVAFANNLGGTVMTCGGLTSEHSIEHALSAYNHELPHGAGLIMISLAYYQYQVDQHVCDEKFIELAKALGKEDATEAQDFITALRELQESCGVADLKMSDYGIKESDLENIAVLAREMLELLFMGDPAPVDQDVCVEILKKAYR
ncbi:MAG: iron-containing alcohol dehydrogenase [Anaerovoracaceae bacterium]